MCCSGDKLYLNPKYFKGNDAEKKLNDTCKKASESGWWPNNSSIESIGAHEMDHSVEKVLGRTNPTNTTRLSQAIAWSKSTESKDIVSQA